MHSGNRVTLSTSPGALSLCCLWRTPLLPWLHVKAHLFRRGNLRQERWSQWPSELLSKMTVQSQETDVAFNGSSHSLSWKKKEVAHFHSAVTQQSVCLYHWSGTSSPCVTSVYPLISSKLWHVVAKNNMKEKYVTAVPRLQFCSAVKISHHW